MPILSTSDSMSSTTGAAGLIAPTTVIVASYFVPLAMNPESFVCPIPLAIPLPVVGLMVATDLSAENHWNFVGRKTFFVVL